MKIEHIALNLNDAEGMVHWYRDHCGMPIHREHHGAVYVAFLGEPPSLLEVYRNPKAPWFATDGLTPLTFHLALYSDDPAADRQRLEAAGASYIEGGCNKDGNGLVMMRCPWGIPLQLCRRPVPLTEVEGK